jgi:Flp pilus assembly protein TadG
VSATGPHRRDDPGQAAIELALALPLLCLLLLGVVQVGVVVRDQLAVQLAAREAARAAVVSATPVAAGAAAALRVVTLRPLTVDVEVGSSTATAHVSTVNRTDVPLIGVLLPDVRVSASVTMALEPP